MCAFVYVNGLNPCVFFDWLRLVKNIEGDDSDIKHMRRYLAYLDEGRYTNLYSWNVSQGCSQYVNGRTRFYNHYPQSEMF